MSMDITFLRDDQIWGDRQGKGQLQVMKVCGTKTGMSDLAVLLGGVSSNANTIDGQLRYGVWSACSLENGNVRIVDYNGYRQSLIPQVRDVGARPALSPSAAASIKPGEARLTGNISGFDIVEFGEYPQTIALNDKGEEISPELEAEFKAGRLQTTGKTYTFDGEKHDLNRKPFQAKEYAEYEHRGKRYIRVEAKTCDSGSVLSNGRELKWTDEACWIEVQPIEWLKDPSGVMVARQALFAGVQFDRNQSYDGNFAKTDMKQYLNKYFAKEMQTGRAVEATASGHAVIGPQTAALAQRSDPDEPHLFWGIRGK